MSVILVICKDSFSRVPQKFMSYNNVETLPEINVVQQLFKADPIHDYY